LSIQPTFGSPTAIPAKLATLYIQPTFDSATAIPAKLATLSIQPTFDSPNSYSHNASVRQRQQI